MSGVMVLNVSYEPLTIVSYKRAINLVLSNKAIVMEESSKPLASNKTTLFIPHVIKLEYFVNKRPDTKKAKFSKAAILLRDNHTCGYCGKHATTVDHIIPKTKGGDNSYENCVAACLRCNRLKADKTLKEVGYELMIKPFTPTPFSNVLARVSNDAELFNVWGKYIFMYYPDLKNIIPPRKVLTIG